MCRYFNITFFFFNEGGRRRRKSGGAGARGHRHSAAGKIGSRKKEQAETADEAAGGVGGNFSLDNILKKDDAIEGDG